MGVNDKDKVGRDAGEICGIDPIGITATDDLQALIGLRPDALVHYGPTAGQADANIRDMGAFLRAGIDVCSTAMTPWVWPHMKLNPPSWIDPITEACAEGGATCFTTGIDPGFANDLFPMTLMGLCAEVRKVKALELVDYINYTGAYEDEMGIGRPPEFTPLLEHTDILVMSWGATVPMMAHAAGVELDEITRPGTSGSPTRRSPPPRASSTRVRWRPSTSPSTASTRESPASAWSTSTGSAPMPRRTGPVAPRTTSTGWRSRERRRSRRRPPSGSPTVSGRDAAAAGCLATGLRALNAVPAVNDLPPGWATALDLPLIPGAGTIR